jgi:hypothetical protein
MTMIVLCAEKHPKTNDTCTLPETHTLSSDAREKQHRSINGLKWPTLHELNPNEGFNDFVLYRM